VAGIRASTCQLDVVARKQGPVLASMRPTSSLWNGDAYRSTSAPGTGRRRHRGDPVELIVMILVPFPIGYFVRNRTAGFIAYLTVHAFVFTFQSTDLVIEWVGGSTQAFGAYPHAPKSEVFSYGVVNLGILLVAIGLLVLGQRLGARRRQSHEAGVQLDTVAH
jgi:hypothetical protein